MEDESLADWAERRDAKVGRLRAVPLVAGDGPMGSHLNPGRPRAIQRWNGHTWEAHGVAMNLADAQCLLYPGDEDPPVAPAPQTHALQVGRGRHRKPRPGD